MEETLYLWIVSNGPPGKGYNISGGDIREMAIELVQYPRFSVDPNFKFSNGWF